MGIQWGNQGTVFAPPGGTQVNSTGLDSLGQTCCLIYISGFCHSRPFLWIQWNQGLRQKRVLVSWGYREKRYTPQNSPYLKHSGLPGLFAFPQTHSTHPHLRAFALTVLSAIRVSSQTPHAQEGPAHNSHCQSFMLSVQSLFVLLHCFTFIPSISCYLQSYYLLWLLIFGINCY